MTGREKEVVCHLGEDDPDRLFTWTDNEKMSKRLTHLSLVRRETTRQRRLIESSFRKE